MFEGTRARIAQGLARSTDRIAHAMLGKAYDVNWWARFLKEADEEDIKSGAVQVRDPMRANAWVNLCVSAIGRNFARAPFRLLDGEMPVESGPVYDLFAGPNPSMSGAQLWEATVSWRKARGEAFWIFEREYQGAPMRPALPKEIWVVNPDRMSHTLNPEGTRITLWTYNGNVSIPLLPDEVIHFMVWNKWDEWRGVNPLIAASEELAQDAQANISNTNMLANGSTPRGILSSKQRLTEAQAKEIQERWEKANRGPTRAHRTAVLGADTTYQQVGLGPKDFEWFEMRSWNRLTYISAYGVPPVVVGVKEDRTALSGSDTREQMHMFWNQVLLPEQEAIEDILDVHFFKRFGLSNLWGEFDNADIQELKDDEKARGEIDRADVAAGLKKINEVRAERGQEPLPWGDEWWISALLVPASSMIPGRAAPAGPAPAPANEQDAQSGDMTKAVARLFALRGPALQIPRRTIWPDMFRAKYWDKFAVRLNVLEGQFRKELQTWFYDQRSALLAKLAQRRTVTVEPSKGAHDEKVIAEAIKVADEVMLEDMDDPSFWGEQETKLHNMATANFRKAMDLEGEDLNGLFHDLGTLPDTVRFDIWDTSAPSHLVDRVNKGKLSEITDTVRDEIRLRIRYGIESGATEQEIADNIRDVYNVARSRTTTIARTELGGIINDSRFEAYRSEGFEAHSWLSAGDERVRDGHLIDGETVNLGDRFSNGLLYPNDPGGDPGQVINCRCVTLPEPLTQASALPAPQKLIDRPRTRADRPFHLIAETRRSGE